MMRRQAGLSLQIAAVFVAALIALPLINLFAPDLAATPIAGFTLTWLLLAVLFYPFTIVLSALFVRGSDAIESEIVREIRDPEGREDDPQAALRRTKSAGRDELR